MSETITSKSKYLEIPQEIRDRLINLHSTTKEYKRRHKEYKHIEAEEIDYDGITQELRMVSIRIEEVKKKVQAELFNLEEIREYVKEIIREDSPQKKEGLQRMLNNEMLKGEKKLETLEKKLCLILNREKEENVLKAIQNAINHLSERLEHLK
ncbi:hypothetical protein NEOKW01_0245 [Nematocida sp. AWRm80]|nr:hypothetical protein NEOKW01_0245 [Nematocida sp. AWRm80]